MKPERSPLNAQAQNREPRIGFMIIAGKLKGAIMQAYICEACARSTHSAGIAVCCVHCGGFLICEREAAGKAAEKEAPETPV